MGIDQCKAAPRFKVLTCKSFEQGGLADAGLTDEIHMRQPVGLFDAETNITITMVGPSEIGNAADAGNLHYAIIADEWRPVQRGVLDELAKSAAASRPQPALIRAC